MTDRINHRAEAERLLHDADDWGQQADEPTPEVGELICLAYSAAHALLAIHDALTDLKNAEADEPEMSEAAEWLSRGGSDPLDEDDHQALMDGDGDIWVRNPGGCFHIHQRDCHDQGCKSTRAHLNGFWGPLTPVPEAECSRCGEIYPGTAEATLEHHRACTGETPENPMGDPLDEDDHRDRMDRLGNLWQHVHEGCWMEPGFPPLSHGPAQCLQLAALPGPLAFAPEPPQEATGDDLSAPEGESGAEEGAEEGPDKAAMEAALRKALAIVEGWDSQ